MDVLGKRPQREPAAFPRGGAIISFYNKAVPRKTKPKLKCPTCKQPVESKAADFPFCSDRCRLIDLGKWASGQYVVSSPVSDISDEISGQNFPASRDED